MQVQAILAVLFVASVGLSQTANSQSNETVDNVEAEAFRKVKPGEVEDLKTTGGLIIGDYFLSAAALQSFRKSPELADGIRRIKTVAWNKTPFDRRNAELTIRQRMDDYLDTAIEFYDGQGNRNRRQMDLTDVEIGDQQLSSALQSVKMASVWNIPLDPGQVKKLTVAVRKRHAIAQSPSE